LALIVFPKRVEDDYENVGGHGRSKWRSEGLLLMPSGCFWWLQFADTLPIICLI